MQREPVSERELRSAKAYLTGNFPLSIETPNAIAAQVLEAMLYGLALDELETYPERINAITPNDIQRVAKTYLKPENLSIVLVGDASTFLDDLPGVGFDSFRGRADFRARHHDGRPSTPDGRGTVAEDSPPSDVSFHESPSLLR